MKHSREYYIMLARMEYKRSYLDIWAYTTFLIPILDLMIGPSNTDTSLPTLVGWEGGKGGGGRGEGVCLRGKPRWTPCAYPGGITLIKPFGILYELQNARNMSLP